MAKKRKEQTTREMLIDAIYDYSGDEFPAIADLLELAKESEHELVDRIINLLDYYHERSNEI